MPKVILFISCTIDGFIAREDGSVDFLDKFNETGEDYGFSELLNSISTIIMGNKTFQQFSGHDKFYEYYKGKDLFVFSRNVSNENEKVTFVNKDARNFMDNLQTDKDIWLLGGSGIIETFQKDNLIDEYIISLLPIIIGQGIPLFRQTQSDIHLELVKSQNFDSGIVNLYYKKGRS